MKKQLLIAAVAATMSVGAFADISIKGDAHFRYANIDRDAGALGGSVATADSTNYAGQRVRLHVTGKSGDSTVRLGLRNDGRTRVSGGADESEGAGATGSGTGIAGEEAALNVDYLYILTKVGALNIKAGDWWDTTGLGVARKSKTDADRIEFSTKVSGWKLGIETGADSSSTVLSASGKVGGFNVTFEHNTAVSVDGTPVSAGANGLDAQAEGDYTDVSIKGKVGAVGVAAEYFSGSNDTRGAAGLGNDADAAVVHLWTKANDITWHVVWAKSEEGVAGITGSGNKFSPLGVSILAGAPGVNGRLAVGNFGNADQEDTVFGIRADLKAAGMGVQVAVGRLELGKGPANHPDGGFWDVIVTRPLGKGSNIKFSAGEYENATSTGAKISVKF